MEKQKPDYIPEPLTSEPENYVREQPNRLRLVIYSSAKALGVLFFRAALFIVPIAFLWWLASC